MEISMLSKNNSISNFVLNVDDIAILFNQLSPIVNEFFMNSFIETHQTETIQSADWIIDGPSFIKFKSLSSFITEE